jgi:hypothetical protein
MVFSNLVRIPRQIYDNVMALPMPMPIPKPADVSEINIGLHYLSFEEEQVLPFTNEHQPSLASVALRGAAREKKKASSRHLSASRVSQ